MQVRVRMLAAGVAVILLGGLAACSDTPASSRPPRSTYTSYTSPSSAAETPGSDDSGEPASSEVTNDLARLPLKRALNAGPVTVNAEYTTRLALKDWKAENNKPLKVSASAANRRKSGQKIYVAKVVMTITAYDDAGQLDVPQTLTDEPNISPGYFVTFPNTYNQTFAIPTVDSGATRIIIDISYELVLEVERTKLGRDFAKQVATDTITVPIAR
jgi:hypothetical protein